MKTQVNLFEKEIPKEKLKKEVKVYTPSFTNQRAIFKLRTIYDEILEKIPPDHPLLRIKSQVDEVLKKVDPKLKTYYSPGIGRPSYPPSIPFKMIFLEHLYNLSDVKVSFMCIVNFLFKWFVGLKPNQSPPDDTTLVVFRRRLKEEGFKEIWDELIKIAHKHGLIKGKLRAIDGTHVFSDTRKLGITMLIRQGIRKIIKEVEKVAEKSGEELKKKYHKALKKTKESEEKLKKKAKKFIEEVKCKVKEIEGVSGKAKEKTIEEIGKLLEMLMSVLRDNWEKFVSFTDPDARWGRKSPKKSFGGYKVHITCDPDSGIVPALETLSGNVNEGGRLPILVEEEMRLGIDAEKYIGDAFYDTTGNREYLKEGEKGAIIPSCNRKRSPPTFKFEGGKAICGAGKTSIGRTRQSEGWLYYFSTKDCMGCKFRDECLNEGEKRKRVYQSDCERLRENLDEKDFKKRFVVERSFGIGKKWHGLGRARYRGRWRVGIQALMIFFVMNAKIIANQIPQGPL